MKKAQLVKAWRDIDRALGAIEWLDEHGISNDNVDFSALVELKNQVEAEVDKKSRKPYELKS